MSADPLGALLGQAGPLIRRLHDAVPDLATGECKWCRARVVYKPYFLDGKEPNPPRWFHTAGVTTCATAPKNWRKGWPCAEPADGYTWATIAAVPDMVTHLRDHAGRQWWRDPLDLQMWFTPYPEDGGCPPEELDQGRPFTPMTMDWRSPLPWPGVRPYWLADKQDGAPDVQG